MYRSENVVSGKKHSLSSLVVTYFLAIWDFEIGILLLLKGYLSSKIWLKRFRTFLCWPHLFFKVFWVQRTPCTLGRNIFNLKTSKTHLRNKLLYCPRKPCVLLQHSLAYNGCSLFSTVVSRLSLSSGKASRTYWACLAHAQRKKSSAFTSCTSRSTLQFSLQPVRFLRKKGRCQW